MSSSTSTAERLAMAYAAAADSIAKVPDYHLPYTGDQTSFAIKKILELDLHGVGGIYILDSTSKEPANFDEVTDPGKYITNYGTSSGGLPDDAEGGMPITLDVFEKDGYLFQLMNDMGDLYYRFSTDDGRTWSPWYPKSATSGGLPLPVDPTNPDSKPPKDTITIIQEHLDGIDENIKQILKDYEDFRKVSLHLGTVDDAKKMLAKTYNYT